jgi:hypothetical protein
MLAVLNFDCVASADSGNPALTFDHFWLQRCESDWILGYRSFLVSLPVFVATNTISASVQLRASPVSTVIAVVISSLTIVCLVLLFIYIFIYFIILFYYYFIIFICFQPLYIVHYFQNHLLLLICFFNLYISELIILVLLLVQAIGIFYVFPRWHHVASSPLLAPDRLLPELLQHAYAQNAQSNPQKA